ncbi:MAG: pitrilysin family protein, partial [Polyangia bacterium]
RVGAAIILAMSIPPRSTKAESPGTSTLSTLERRAGPSGSLLLVEPNHALPLVHVIVAIRSGSSWDPHKKDGVMNLMGEVARRGAAGRTREQLDRQLDALGATLDVETDADSIRLQGHVLARHLDDYLRITADVLLRPDFSAAEFARTRREILADIEESRNDDQALGQRFFIRNLYSDHPYGHSPEGDQASLERVRRDDLVVHHRRHVVGPNVVIAAAGDVNVDDFAARVQRLFATLPRAAAPGPNPLAVREPQPPQGWRIQIVDKPDRQQAQVLFGHFGVRASDPDFVPLLVAISSFGGHGMKSTLMDELRTKRGLAYGTYMGLAGRLNRGPVRGWFFTSNANTVSTLKLVLRLYVTLMENGIDEQRLAFAKAFLAGSQVSEVDDPGQRLTARVNYEIAGNGTLNAGFVDELPARVRAVTAAQVKAAVLRHLRARDLAITVVATAADLWTRLVDAKVQPGAIDVVPYDSY